MAIGINGGDPDEALAAAHARIRELERELALFRADPTRVRRGLYQHYKGPQYFVVGVGILDEDGHGDPRAPRQVIYESTQSVETGLLNIRSELAFRENTQWPDGVTRPRFRRIEP